MKKTLLIYLVLNVISLIILASASIAQDDCINYEIPDDYCIYTYGDSSTCNLETNECILPEDFVQLTEETEDEITDDQTIPTTTVATDEIQSQIDTLSNRISSLESNDIETVLKIDNIQNSLNLLSQKFDELKKKDIKSFSTGLAIIQKDLENITSEVNQTQTVVKSSSAKINFWNIVWILLIIIAIFLLIIYFFQRSGKIKKINLFDSFTKMFQSKPTVSRQIHNFITQQIRLGKKYRQIHNELLNAGWSPEEIEWAYKETTRKNYQEFVKTKNLGYNLMANGEKNDGEKRISARTSVQSSIVSDKNRIMIISLVTIVLIVVGVFFLSKASGKAIHFEKLVAGSKNAMSGEISYSIQCTPPHILSLERDTCCLDTNNNKVCDDIDREQNQTQFEITDEGKKCIDNRQCTPALCINNQCAYISKLYKMKMNACSKICSFYSVEILTSDGETYNIKPQEGSYSGAGAISWKLLAGSNHCQEEPTIIPIKITKNKPGQTLSEEIITIRKTESSKVITHPYAPKLAFSLTAKNVHELCAYDEAELNQLMIKQKQLQSPIKVVE